MLLLCAVLGLLILKKKDNSLFNDFETEIFQISLLILRKHITSKLQINLSVKSKETIAVFLSLIFHKKIYFRQNDELFIVNIMVHICTTAL
jgi:hypothetical protein